MSTEAPDAIVTPESQPKTSPPMVTDPRFPLTEIMGDRLQEKIETWEDWLVAWKSANYWYRLSLLDIGLLMSRRSQNRRETVCRQYAFYLTLADLDTSVELGKFHQREWRALCEKATDILIKELFSDKDSQGNRQPWQWLLRAPELFDTLLWYFRPKLTETRISIGAINNLNSEDRRDVLRKFLRDFCRLAWSSEERDSWPWLEQKLPQLVPILCGLGGLALWEAADPNGVIRFDDACMEVLKQTALSLRIWHHNDTQYLLPESIEEAVAHGTESARVYLVLQTMKKEAEKAETERKRLERIEELQRELKALTEGKSPVGEEPFGDGDTNNSDPV